MSLDRRNRSEVIFNNLFSKESGDANRKEQNSSKNRLMAEDTHDNIFDSLMFPDAFPKKATDFNLDDNLSLDNRFKPNKLLIKTITNKFHELFLKLIAENKTLKIDLHNYRHDQYENNLNERRLEFNKKESSNGLHPTNHFNIGNMSLQDLNTDFHLNDKLRNNSELDENEMIFHLKEEELEVFNSILNEFLMQLNELEAKDDFLRREIGKKLDDLNRINSEYEEISKNKQILLIEVQNVTLKLNEYKTFLNNLPQDFIKKNDSVIVHSHTDEDNAYNFSIRNKDDKVAFNNFEFASTDEISALLNIENKDYLLMKLYEENLQYKEIVIKLKAAALKNEGEIAFMEKEFNDLHSLKVNIMEFVKIIEMGFKELKLKIEKLNSNYTKLKFLLEDSKNVNLK